jgi:hypothetical protein
MSLHPDDKILIVNRGILAVGRPPIVIEATVIACFSRPDDVDGDGDWFNCQTGQHDSCSLSVRDEGVTWSRDASALGQESLLAAFMLERSL